MDGLYEASQRALEEALRTLRTQKPQDKSETDRAFAVTITELKKATAYFKVFVVQAANDIQE